MATFIVVQSWKTLHIYKSDVNMLCLTKWQTDKSVNVSGTGYDTLYCSSYKKYAEAQTQVAQQVRDYFVWYTLCKTLEIKYL